MDVRKIRPEEMMTMHFAHQDVLAREEEKEQRSFKLHHAMKLGNIEHQDVGIIMQLDTGEMIETYSPVIDYADNFVELKGGYFIPVWAIVDVED